jgi:pilus assembly protein CpaE
VYRAVHRRRPVSHPNILVFLPAKAGSGCSTVALNTAGSLANRFEVKTLLVEGDRRSGALSIMLNLQDRSGLAEVLARSDALTTMEWQQHVVSLGKLDILLANPFKPGALPTWADYYHLLQFIEKHYEFIVVDLPELINPSTAELTKAARTIFIVCQPELTSLTLAGLRRDEMVACEVPREKICVLGNRWEPHRLQREDLVQTAKASMFAALPNDYEEVKNAALESRLVSRESSFGQACAELARRLSGRPESPPGGPIARFLRRLGK